MYIVVQYNINTLLHYYYVNDCTYYNNPVINDV